MNITKIYKIDFHMFFNDKSDLLHSVIFDHIYLAEVKNLILDILQFLLFISYLILWEFIGEPDPCGV